MKEYFIQSRKFITLLFFTFLTINIYAQQKLNLDIINCTLNGKNLFTYNSDEISSLLGRPSRASEMGIKSYGKTFNYDKTGIHIFFNDNSYLTTFRFDFVLVSSLSMGTCEKIINTKPTLTKDMTLNQIKNMFKDYENEVYKLLDSNRFVVKFQDYKVIFIFAPNSDFLDRVEITIKKL